MTALTADRLELEHLCDLAVELEPPQIVQTPFGMRLTYIVRGGTVSGARLAGAFLPGGGDWIRFGSDGIGRLDVRATFRTENGALVHLTSTGVAVLSDAAKARLAAGERIRAEEMYTRSQPRFEADPAGPHAWLNSITAIAINELAPDRVDYRVFQVL